MESLAGSFSYFHTGMQSNLVVKARIRALMNRRNAKVEFTSREG